VLHLSKWENRRVSTKEESLKLAKDFPEDWYLTLRGKHSRGELKNEKTFGFASTQFLQKLDADTMGERNSKCLSNHKNHIRLHLLPFFGPLGLSEISTTKIQEYRIARMQSRYRGKAPAAATLQKEIVTLRMTLKAAVRHDWLDHLPVSIVPQSRISPSLPPSATETANVALDASSSTKTTFSLLFIAILQK